MIRFIMMFALLGICLMHIGGGAEIGIEGTGTGPTKKTPVLKNEKLVFFVVESIEGEASFRPPKRFKLEPITSGKQIPEGSGIRVSSGAVVSIRTPTGDTMTIRDKSTLILRSLASKESSNQRKVNISLMSGSLDVKVAPLGKEEEFKIRTPTAVAGVRGTGFICNVKPTGGTDLAVYHGLVRFRALNVNVKPVNLPSGTMARLAPDGKMKVVKFKVPEARVKTFEKWQNRLKKWRDGRRDRNEDSPSDEKEDSSQVDDDKPSSEQPENTSSDSQSSDTDNSSIGTEESEAIQPEVSETESESSPVSDELIDLDSVIDTGENIDPETLTEGSDITQEGGPSNNDATSTESSTNDGTTGETPEIDINNAIENAVEEGSQSATEEAQSEVQTQTELEVQQTIEAIRVRVNMGLEN